MQIVIVGAGTVGFDLAVQLQKAGHDVGLVERSEARCSEISAKLDILVVEGHGSSPRALEQAGIADAHMVLAVTSNDEVNILVCGIAEQHGVATRIARVRNREFTRRKARVDLHRLGVTRVIDPEGVVVRVIDQIARIPDVVEAFGFHEGEILVARHVMTPEMPIIGRTLIEILQMAGTERFLSVALRRGHEARIPVGDDVIQPGDDMTTLFHRDSLPKYLDLLGLSGRRVRKAVVAGDSLTAIQLCEVFETWVDDVTLISRNEAHAQRAAKRLREAEVIHGEPTERDILQEVHVAGADLFVGCGLDTPQNVMSALLARAEGARRVVAMSLEPQSNELFRSIGVDHVISPRRAMTHAIFDLIHVGRGAVELHLRDMELEAIELTAADGSPITRAPLAKTWQAMRRHAIVGAIVRDGTMLIPRGDTRLDAGDEAIIIAEARAIPKLRKLFGESRP